MGGKIFGPVILLLATACGGAPAVVPANPNVTPYSPPLPLNRTFVLESWGDPPGDTTVTFAAGEARTILYTRGGGDRNLFARIDFPAGTVRPGRGDSITVRLSPRAGLYGLDLVANADFAPGASITFSYAMHFVASGEARAAYGSDIRFERFLGIGRVTGDTTLVFLDSWRPAADLLTAPLVGPGRYLVAAPRATPAFKSIAW